MNRINSGVITILALMFAFSGLALAAEEQHQHHMQHKQHEEHKQHQVGNVQHEHIHHVHKAGSWMVDYRFMRMDMRQMLAGSNNVQTSSVAKRGSVFINSAGGNYMMAPTKMSMDMHMLMAMYAQSDALSWMVMANYLDNRMDMLAMSGVTSQMSAKGMGDGEITVMYKLHHEKSRQLLVNLGLSLPIGKITNSNAQGMLPYQMQLGSGSWDLKPSITYRDGSGILGWGAQGSYIYRTAKNSQDYALGDRAEAQLWLKVNPLKSGAVTLRLSYADWQKIDGRAKGMTMMQRNMSPLFDTVNSGGRRMDLSLGYSHMFGSGHMIGVEYGRPLLQDLNGVQMKAYQMLSASWQVMF